ncbi:MAG: SPOR domain-containing protein [Sedimentitalea sp.]
MSMVFRLKPHGIRVTAFLLGATILAGCDDGSMPKFLQPGEPSEVATRAPNDPSRPTKLIERDVEAPNVFQVTEAGLWDGRPSLGGVWVAHPNVTDPERVIIRNGSNNQFVIGALFRREREIPGPRIQVSSDAAEALGLLAGSPVQLNVTALRSEEIAPEPVPEPGIELASLSEAATIDALPLPEAAPVEATALPAAAPAISDSELAAALSPSQPQPIADLPNSDLPETTLPETVAADEPAPGVGSRMEDAADREPVRTKKPFAWPWARKPQPVSEPPLGEVAAVTAAAAVTATPIPQPKPKAAPKPRASTLSKPFIQIGIFSQENNADSAAAQMRRAGMVPTVYDQTSNGKRFYRVVVGPAQSSAERTSLLRKVKTTGFSDAYIVSN